jgi:hypothetical protein
MYCLVNPVTAYTCGKRPALAHETTAPLPELAHETTNPLPAPAHETTAPLPAPVHEAQTCNLTDSVVLAVDLVFRLKNVTTGGRMVHHAIRHSGENVGWMNVWGLNPEGLGSPWFKDSVFCREEGKNSAEDLRGKGTPCHTRLQN